MATTEQTLFMMRTGTTANKSQTQALDFDELFNSYFRRLYAFVAYRTGDRNAAEDITAQVFEKAWRARRSYDPARGGVSSWLFTIARNSVTDFLRRRQSSREGSLEREVAASSGEDPQKLLEASERRLELGRALDTLDEREREVVAMKFGGGMSNNDIAAVLTLTPTNVGTILYRSLNKLNNHLEGGIEND